MKKQLLTSTNNKITVVIPAYNNPAYTEKTLDSLLGQTYKNINVVLIDDGSPKSLRRIAQSFENKVTGGIIFKFIENKTNLCADHIYQIYENILTNWCCILHHDDILIEKNFFSEVINLIESDNEAYFFYANSLLERSRKKMVSDNNESWRKVSGPNFLEYLLTRGHTAWSSIIFKSIELKKFSYPGPPFLIDEKMRNELGLDCDEGFSTLYLLSQLGNGYVTGKPVSIRGEPETQYSRSGKWKTVSQSLFFIYYGLFKTSFHERYSDEMRKAALASLFLYGIDLNESKKIDSIKSYYNDSIQELSWLYKLCVLFTVFHFKKIALKILIFNQKLKTKQKLCIIFFLFLISLPILVPFSLIFSFLRKKRIRKIVKTLFKR
jgi:glycosyltransferase involved in cell wall biosynthesis